VQWFNVPVGKYKFENETARRLGDFQRKIQEFTVTGRGRRNPPMDGARLAVGKVRERWKLRNGVEWQAETSGSKPLYSHSNLTAHRRGLRSGVGEKKHSFFGEESSSKKDSFEPGSDQVLRARE